MIKKKAVKTILFTTLAMMMGLGALTAQAKNVKPKRVSIAKSSKTVYVGNTYEIEAKMTPHYAEDDYLYWTIVSGKNVVKFADNDRYDDDIKIRAVKAGTAKVRCRIRGTKKYDTITIKAVKKKYSYAFSRVGAATRTVYVGDDFELKVKKTAGLKDNDLKWSIQKKSILKFDDRDITDDDVELEAKKTGTTYVTCYNRKTKKKINYKIKVVKRKYSYAFSRVGAATRTVELGDDFELKVKKTSGLKDNDLKWKIHNTNILRFDDRDITDDEVELEARRTGTTYVSCYNSKNKKTITYKINVIRDRDDNDDDDRYDRDDDDDDDDRYDRDDDD